MEDKFKKAFDMLDYDPLTGVFTWSGKPSHKCKIGAIAGSISADGYRQITLAGRTYTAHRLAWLKVYGAWPENLIDHINSIRLDNRISNLRQANNSQNMHNPLRKKLQGKSSRFMGVSFDKQKKQWGAQICVSGKTTRLGFFENEEDAALAYKNAKTLLLETFFGGKNGKS